jgi:hypothetical protein
MSGPGPSPSIICETERLILRPTTMEDADFSFDHRSSGVPIHRRIQDA